ncbi:MAG: hypothetical protein ACFFG0_46710 [Candidatus Thorarchaeota archaeon]
MYWSNNIKNDSKFKKSFFRNTTAGTIMFSLEDTKQGRLSFYHISYWHELFMKHCGDIPVYLFGNKFDLIDEENIDDSKIKELVDEFSFQGYYLFSAITGHNFIKTFNGNTIELYNYHNARLPNVEPIFSPKNNNKKK